MSEPDPIHPDPIHEARRQWVAHGWADAAAGMEMVTAMTRAQQLLMERIELALRPFGLTFARFEVLRLLAFTKSGSMGMGRLGSLLQVHPTSVTSAVQRLEAQGFVVRARGESDKRVVRAGITDAGRAVVEPATTAVNAIFADPGLSPEGVEEMIRMLASLRAGIADPDATAATAAGGSPA